MNLLRNIFLVTAFFVIALIASAQSAQTGTSICRQIEKSVNALADFTQTSCEPGAGEAKGSLSFIVLSSRPVFAVEPSKKAWLMTVVGASGSVLNENKTVKAEELVVSDAALMKGRVAFALSTDLVKSLQSRVKGGQMKLDDMYLEIQRNLKRKVIPSKR